MIQDLRDIGDAIVRRLLLLRVVDQQGIDVISLSTEERLHQLRRRQVGYTLKLLMPVLFAYSIQGARIGVVLQFP